MISTNFVLKVEIPLISWTRRAALLTLQKMSTFFVEFKKVFQEQQEQQ